MIAALLFCLAPLPQPKPLSAETLHGKWDYQWHGRLFGWVVFHADGTYVSAHEPYISPTHCGYWALNRGQLTLHEAIFPYGFMDETPLTRYIYTFDKVKMHPVPFLSGGTGQGEVVLKKQPAGG